MADFIYEYPYQIGKDETKYRLISKDYVSVLEIPTPRWSTYDAVALGIAPLSGVPTSTQERAWSSPIWYNGIARWD